MAITPLAIFRQVWLAMTASLGYLTIGLVRGWSSPAIPSLKEFSPELVPHSGAISWISAVPPLGAFMGSLICGPLMQRLGRRTTLMLSAPLFVTAWIGIAYSTSWTYLVLFRASTGVCVGIVLPSAQIYVSECSHPKVRGMVGSMPALFMAVGILVSYVLGSYLAWNQLAMSSAVFPALLFFLLLLLPESPSWLQSKGRVTAASEALEWLQRKPNIATVELSTITQKDKTVASVTMKEPKTIVLKKAILTGPYSRSALCRSSVLVPFGLVAAILVFQQISGIDSIIFYTVSIFQASGSTLGEYEATMIVGAVQVVATGLALFLVDTYGRKPLLLVSGATMGASMMSLSSYFYLYERGQAESLGLVPLLSQLLFIAGYSIGFCNIPFILMGELLPAAQRSFLSSLAGALNLGSMFVVIKTFHDIVDVVGNEGAFGGYAFLCFLSCVFVHVFLPETKGKTLEDIEKHFEKNDSPPK